MRGILALVVLLAGCGGEPTAPDDASVPDLALRDLTVPDFATTPLCNDSQVGDAGLPPTLASVQRIFDDACVGCHCCGDPVDLTAGKSYASVVNRAFSPENKVDETCGGVMVTPGDPAHSYLYQKLTQSQPCAGMQMPIGEFMSVALPVCQLDAVRRWIESGAPAQ